MWSTATPAKSGEVTQHDGSALNLAKLPEDYNPTDKIAAIVHSQTYEARGEILTRLIYVDPGPMDLQCHLDTPSTPLDSLADADLVPGANALAAINASLR